MKRRLRLLWLLVPVLVFGILIFQRPSNPSLLARAHKIADIGLWGRSFWIDSDRMLIFETRTGPPAAHILNIGTGKTESLPALNETLKWFTAGDRMEVSPNGEWLVVAAGKAFGYRHYLCSVRDGSIRTYIDPGVFITWLSDNSGWITRDRHGRSFQLLNTGSQRRVLLNPIKNVTQPGADLGPTPAGTYVSADWSPYVTANLKITETDIRSGKLVHSYSIPAPGGCDLSEVSMSRDGRRLMWQTRKGAREGLPGRLKDFIMSLHPEPDMDTLWVSNLDGTERKLLGNIEAQRQVDYDSGLGVEFTPDGKSLSFTHQGWLWTVPVD